MTSWAKPGVKCECINNEWPSGAWYGWEFLPELGKTYTVRETLEIDGQAALRLAEIDNPRGDYSWGFIEPCFAVARFRPVVPAEHEKDLAIFTPLLDTVEEDA